MDDKVVYMGKLVREAEANKTKSEQKMAKNIDREVDTILQKTIGKTGPYIPKADLQYDEFLAIKGTFKNADFAWTSGTP